ncbi:MAG TPA: tetratricopeptide repeat protein [Candidatus Obscuribacterales bacterium]
MKCRPAGRKSAYTAAFALTGLLLCNPTATTAQIPGVPGTAPTPGTSSAPSQSGVLTGKIKTNIIPAETLLSQGRYAEAEELFRELLVNNPQDLQATVGLGTALAKQFKLDGADDLFDRVLLSDPNNALAYAGKATVVLNRLQSSSGTIRANKDSMLKQAEEFARHAVMLAPASGEAHATLGMVLKEQGKLDDAASELRNAVSFDPQHSQAFSALGMIKLDQNSLAEAAENFKRAIALSSSNSSAHFGLGSVYLKQGNYDEAIKELNTSLYQFPNSWPVRMALGETYQRQGNEVAALKEYQLSILIKPENAQPYLRIADIREGRGDLELALADLRSGLTQIPYDLDLRQRIADVCLKLEKADDAIKAYRTMLQMTPNNPQAVKGLSQALYLKAQKAAVGALLASNDYEAAMKSLDEAIKLSPDDMELRLAQAKLTSLAGAKPDLSKMGAPKSDGERVAYAQALMAQGEFLQAGQQMKLVVNDLNDPRQAFAVADVALMMKDLDNAEASYNKALSLSGSADRAQRGLAEIARLRKLAQDDVRVADELFKKNQLDGAIDRYREATATNPTLPEARLGLARSLEKLPKAKSAQLSEAAQQYQNYLTLKTTIATKDADKLNQQIRKLKDKAARLADREARSNRG